jgi:hypothetical protein
MHYEVTLKTACGVFPVEADKFCCEDGYTVFYARPSPGEKFEEVATFKTSSIRNIKELSK